MILILSIAAMLTQPRPCAEEMDDGHATTKAGRPEQLEYG